MRNAYRLAGLQAYTPGRSYERSEELLNKSLKLFEEANDSINIINSCSNLADIYFFEKNYTKSIPMLERIEQLGNKHTKVAANYILACAHIFLSSQDSCIFYFEKAIDMMKNEEHRDKRSLLRNYADCFNFFNKSNQAIEVLDSLKIKYPYEDFNERMALITYTNTWLNLNQLDSAKVYLQRFDEVIKNVSPENPQYYTFQLHYCMADAVYKTKLGLPAEMITFAQHSDRFRRFLEYSVKRDKERVFQQNKLAKDKNKIEIEKVKQLQLYLWIIIALLAVTVVLVVIYQRRILNKERLIQKTKEHLQEYMVKLRENENIINKNQEVIDVLTTQVEGNLELQEQINEIEEIRQNNKSLQEYNTTLKARIEEYSKIVLIKDVESKTVDELKDRNILLQERERFLTNQLINNNETLRKLKNTPKFVTEEGWHEIINTINIFSNNFTIRLHSIYPQLTEEDIRYCCLIKLHLSTSVIAVLMSVSSASVTKRKHRIKEKMNKEKNGLFVEESLDSFLWDY